jgi:hypothetical protein
MTKRSRKIWLYFERRSNHKSKITIQNDAKAM